MTPPPLLRQFMDQRAVTADEFDVLVQRDDRVVLRLHASAGDLVVKLDRTQGAFMDEAAAMQTLAEAGVAVSTVIEVQAGPPAVLIATWTEGEPITPTADTGILRDVGEVLRGIHALPAMAPWSGHSSIDNWITAWVEIILPWWQESSVDILLVTALGDWLSDVRPLLGDEHGTQMLFDGRPDHFLVDAGGAVRLIDVADLQAGDPVMDLAVLDLDAPGIVKLVLPGYAPTPREQVRIDNLLDFYVVLRALSGAEWQSRVGGDVGMVERNLGRAREMVSRRCGLQG